MLEQERHPKLHDDFDFSAIRFIFSITEATQPSKDKDKTKEKDERKEREQQYLKRLNEYAKKGRMSLGDAIRRIERAVEVLIEEHKRRRRYNALPAIYEVVAVSPFPAVIRGTYRRVVRGKVLWKGATLGGRVKDVVKRHSPTAAVAQSSALISRLRKFRKLHSRSIKQLEIP